MPKRAPIRPSAVVLVLALLALVRFSLTGMGAAQLPPERQKAFDLINEAWKKRISKDMEFKGSYLGTLRVADASQKHIDFDVVLENKDLLARLEDHAAKAYAEVDEKARAQFPGKIQRRNTHILDLKEIRETVAKNDKVEDTWVKRVKLVEGKELRIQCDTVKEDKGDHKDLPPIADLSAVLSDMMKDSVKAINGQLKKAGFDIQLIEPTKASIESSASVSSVTRLLRTKVEEDSAKNPRWDGLLISRGYYNSDGTYTLKGLVESEEQLTQFRKFVTDLLGPSASASLPYEGTVPVFLQDKPRLLTDKGWTLEMKPTAASSIVRKALQGKIASDKIEDTWVERVRFGPKSNVLVTGQAPANGPNLLDALKNTLEAAVKGLNTTAQTNLSAQEALITMTPLPGEAAPGLAAFLRNEIARDPRLYGISLERAVYTPEGVYELYGSVDSEEQRTELRRLLTRHVIQPEQGGSKITEPLSRKPTWNLLSGGTWSIQQMKVVPILVELRRQLQERITRDRIEDTWISQVRFGPKQNLAIQGQSPKDGPDLSKLLTDTLKISVDSLNRKFDSNLSAANAQFVLEPTPSLADFLRRQVSGDPRWYGVSIERAIYTPDGIYELYGIVDSEEQRTELRRLLARHIIQPEQGAVSSVSSLSTPPTQNLLSRKTWTVEKMRVEPIRLLVARLNEVLLADRDWDGVQLQRGVYGANGELTFTALAVSNNRGDLKKWLEDVAKGDPTFEARRRGRPFEVAIERISANEDLGDAALSRAQSALLAYDQEVAYASLRIALQHLPKSSLVWGLNAWYNLSMGYDKLPNRDLRRLVEIEQDQAPVVAEMEGDGAPEDTRVRPRGFFQDAGRMERMASFQGAVRAMFSEESLRAFKDNINKKPRLILADVPFDILPMKK